MKTGILISNIGTPKSYSVPDVKTYLNEFLMDKDVISLPFLLRYPLVKWLIVPRRAPRSAEKYKSVWMPTGSPLLVLTEKFKTKLQQSLDAKFKDQFSVQIGMRFANPNIQDAMEIFAKQNIQKVIILPMFPQFAEATTGSVMGKIAEVNRNFKFKIQEIKPFFENPLYIKSFAAIIKNSLAEAESQNQKPEFLLFSYHGLPEGQIKKIDPGCLQQNNCCLRPNACALNCYRAQCFRTTQLLLKELQWPEERHATSFQSRLGPVQWIRPYTDDQLESIAKSGVKNIAVVCPAFATDCIETLEEIGIEGRAHFKHHGGQNLTFIPCLNDNDLWVENALQLVTTATH